MSTGATERTVISRCRRLLIFPPPREGSGLAHCIEGLVLLGTLVVLASYYVSITVGTTTTLAVEPASEKPRVHRWQSPVAGTQELFWQPTQLLGIASRVERLLDPRVRAEIARQKKEAKSGLGMTQRMTAEDRRIAERKAELKALQKKIAAASAPAATALSPAAARLDKLLPVKVAMHPSTRSTGRGDAAPSFTATQPLTGTVADMRTASRDGAARSSTVCSYAGKRGSDGGAER